MQATLILFSLAFKRRGFPHTQGAGVWDEGCETFPAYSRLLLSAGVSGVVLSFVLIVSVRSHRSLVSSVLSDCNMKKKTPVDDST